jgi:hypothetical protein
MYIVTILILYIDGYHGPGLKGEWAGSVCVFLIRFPVAVDSVQQ